MKKHHTFAGVFAGIAAASIWGGMYVVSKIVLEVIPPFALLTIRLAMGAAALGLVIYFRKKKPLRLPKTFFGKARWLVLWGTAFHLDFNLLAQNFQPHPMGRWSLPPHLPSF